LQRKVKFSFEDLEVWQKAVEFEHKVINIAENIQTDRKHFRLIERCTPLVGQFWG